MSAIVARKLTRRFGDVVAVDSLSFDVGPGEVVGLLGANGAGKTTTMRMILGLLAPSGGTVTVAGTDAADADHRNIGYVPQGLGLYRDLTAAENVAFAAAAFGVSAPSLAEAGLGGIADRRVGALSLGARRRLAFVVACCHRPPVLVLDEPTSGVGPLGRARLWETIREAADSGAAVLVSTHHMEEAEECDRIILMSAGRRVASGRVADVIGEARSVKVAGEVTEADLVSLGRAGGTVLATVGGWRVVGLTSHQVSAILGPGPEVAEVPATFEEAFLVLSA